MSAFLFLEKGGVSLPFSMNKNNKIVSAVMSKRQIEMIDEIKAKTGFTTISMVIVNALLCYYNELKTNKK